MGLLRSLVLMLLLVWLRGLWAQPPNSARSLDAVLQDYAYRALVRPKTGTPYDGAVPLDLSGIKIAALRLRSGSLRRKGFDMYKEFGMPMGITEQPYVERLVFVYQNLGNWTEKYYPLPNYTYLTPILGVGPPKPADHLQEVFYRMGLDDKDIVALSNTHTLGRSRPDHSGWGKPETKYTVQVTQQ